MTTLQMDDRELLSRWASGADESAFRALVERYAGLVHGVARRRTGGQQALAQEIGQNVFTMLARKAAGLRSHPSLASWLHRAAVLESAHQVRRETSHSRRLARLAELSPTPDMISAAAPEESPDDLSPELDEALARLSESDRALLMERFFEDRSYREMAESSGGNEAALRKRLERALARLAPHLRRRGAAAAASGSSSGAAGLSDPLRAALGSGAPADFVSTVSGAALSAAPAVTSFQLILHSLKLMTYGKSLTLAGAGLALFLAFGGSYTAARRFSAEAEGGGASGGAAGQGDHASAPGQAAGRGGPGGRPVGRTTGNPGDSPRQALLREQLKAISKTLVVDAQNRSVAIQFDGGEGDSSGVSGFEALGGFAFESLEEAWKMMPDFKGQGRDYESVAFFLTGLRLMKEPPEKVLRELLAPEFQAGGKPPQAALMAASAAWFKTDPAAAWAWRREAVESGIFPTDRRRPIGAEEVGEWLGKDPQGALAALAPLGPDWDRFTREVLNKALKDEEKRGKVWPVLEKADDRTALMIADSHPQASDWSRDNLLPWLLTRSWSDGTEASRVLNGWTWRDGELDEERFGMLCQAAGDLPTPAANEAVLRALRGVFENVSPEARPKLLEKLVKDPARREKLAAQL